MVLYYLIAKESKYKKDENNVYIDIVTGLRVDGKEPKTEKERIKKAEEMRDWFAKQIDINRFWVVPITKEKFDDFQK